MDSRLAFALSCQVAVSVAMIIGQCDYERLGAEKRSQMVCVSFHMVGTVSMLCFV